MHIHRNTYKHMAFPVITTIQTFMCSLHQNWMCTIQMHKSLPDRSFMYLHFSRFRNKPSFTALTRNCIWEKYLSKGYRNKPANYCRVPVPAPERVLAWFSEQWILPTGWKPCVFQEHPSLIEFSGSLGFVKVFAQIKYLKYTLNKLHK